MKPRQPFTPEQREAAVARTLKVGASAASKELGIAAGTLRVWIHKARQGVQGYTPPVEQVPTPAEEEPEPPLAQVPPPPAQEPPPPPSKAPAVGRIYTPSEKARAMELMDKVGPTEASKELGISRYSLYDWKRRVQRAAAGQGDSPTTGPDPADIEARRDKEILNLWHQHPGLGPSQIRNQLRRQGVKVATNTVRRVMEDAGYRPPKVKRDPHSERYEAVRPNHLWHMDRPAQGLCTATSTGPTPSRSSSSTTTAAS